MYYPDETLPLSELKFMEGRKNYQVARLINMNTPGINTYDSQGLEVVDRIKVKIFNFISAFEYKGDRFFTSDLDLMAEHMIASGFNSEKLLKQFSNGLKEYRATTEKLYEIGGVYNSISKLESNNADSDKVFSDLKKL